MDKREVLSKYFGYRSFREGQEVIVDRLLEGGDVLAVMPTGAGKSVCFQVPALMMEGTTVVISPLISLMQDQVNALVQNGVEAACINSSMSTEEYFAACRLAEAGRLKLLYIAPERLESEGFAELCSRITIPLAAVDEAHCVSHWGQDFRPSYLKIQGFVNSLPKRPTLAAFTATATDAVKRDIISLLGLSEPLSLTTGFDRPNLFFEVRRPENKDAELLDILSENSGSAIVYCATRKNTEKVAEMLTRHGISADRYHAGLPNAERARVQDDFIYDRTSVIVATNAFGMGIDKSNVSLVVHYNCPKDIESYYQEAGRAGRDGSPAKCIILFSFADTKLAEFMINAGHEDENLPEGEREELIKRDRERLRKMTDYANTRGCLRSFILKYFGEKHAGSCGNCGNCIGEFELEDITLEAKKLLSCIFRLKQRGRAMGKVSVCRILLGNKDKRYVEMGLTDLSTFGIMKGEDSRRLRAIADHLEAEGYFEVCGDYRICVLTPKADMFVRSDERIMMKLPKNETRRTGKKSDAPPRKKIIKEDEQHTRPELFERLKVMRRQIAAAMNVPPYVVFSDAALWGMCAILPKDPEEFMTVPGIGSKKTERYGKTFLAVIKEYIKDGE